MKMGIFTRWHLLGLVLLVGICGRAAGEDLEWKSKALELQAVYGQESVAGDLSFTNKSGRTVTITGIKTSCKCVKATADQASYAPGAEGVVHVVFLPEGRTGTHQQNILVTTDAKDVEPTKLDVNVTIPVPEKMPYPPYRRP